MEAEKSLPERLRGKEEQQQGGAHPRFEQEEAETSKSHEGRILMDVDARPSARGGRRRGQGANFVGDPVHVAEQAVVAVGDLDEA